MTNYAIRQIRPLVQKQHIEQQREYFEKWAQGTSLKLFWVSELVKSGSARRPTEFKRLHLKIATTSIICCNSEVQQF